MSLRIVSIAFALVIYQPPAVRNPKFRIPPDAKALNTHVKSLEFSKSFPGSSRLRRDSHARDRSKTLWLVGDSCLPHGATRF